MDATIPVTAPAPGVTARTGRTRRRLALYALAICCVSAVAGGVTYGAFTATTSSSANSFTAAASFGAACPSVTPIYLTGFEAGAVSVTGAGLFDEVYQAGGVPTADSTIKRSGDYSLRVAKSGAGATYLLQSITGTVVVERLAVRFETLPVDDLDR